MSKYKTLLSGMKGEEVRLLQSALADKGFLEREHVIGTYGPKTVTAVTAFQKANGLLADGVAGDRTQSTLFNGAEKNPRWLKESDLEQAAQRLGVSVSLIHAFAEVESAGDGYYADGSLKLLYERHIFYRQARARGLTGLMDLLSIHRPDICNKLSGGYGNTAAEVGKHRDAITFHEQVGYESASYGRFQLMGFRYAWCGYNSASAMYHAFNKGTEAVQMEALVNFIQAQPELWTAMKEVDYLKMACIYNGESQKGYDKRLKDAHERFKAQGYK